MQPAQTFHDHVRELRLRFSYIAGALIITGALGYVLRNPIIGFIQRPLHVPLYYTSPAGSFNFVIKIATTLGIFLALPVIVYNLVRFIEPALPKRVTGKQIAKITGASFVLAVIGATFGYFIIVPLSLHFFSTYSSSIVKPLISANEYLSFILNILLTFALMFQIPLVIGFINTIKPIDPKKLMKYQKYIVVGALVIAVLLPFTYDPITQFVLALPIILLFYLSILLVKFLNRKSGPRYHREVTVEPEPEDSPKYALEPETVNQPVPQGLPEVALAAVTEAPKPRLRPGIYIDGFKNSMPTNIVMRYKSLETSTIDDYRSKNSLNRGGHKPQSLDGFNFAS